MRVSVIVVAHNSRAYLPACLSSLLPQLGPERELLVVDCGSTDGSAAVVAQHFPGVRLLRAANLGYGGGCNLGAAAASGAALVFLNPDTIAAPGALDALLAPLLDPSIGLTTGLLVHLARPSVVNAAGNTVHYTGLAFCRGAEQPATALSQAADVDAISGAAFAVRAATFAALDGFDPRFFMYCEDTDLSLRARLRGLRVRYVPEAVFAHDYRLALTPAKAFYLDRNRHLMLLKQLSASTYLRLLPGLLLAEVATAAYLALRGFWGVKPQVYRWLWHNARALRTEQRANQTSQPAQRAVYAALSAELAFGQVAGGGLAALAAQLLHPLFAAVRPRRA